MTKAPVPTKTQMAFFDETEAHFSGKPARFHGTDNPLELCAIALLLRRPSVLREAFEREVGCPNGPDLIARLRDLGLGEEHLRCTRIRVIDRDGKVCWPSVYFLTDQGRRAIEKWLTKRERTAP